MTPIERRILDLSFKLGLSHIGSCLTAADAIDYVYSKMTGNDKFVLSCGHAHLAHAVVMEAYGKLADAEANISKYGIHCDIKGGCHASTGSLGQGLPIALGMAMADRDRQVYCLLSDGELAEGTTWEAANIIHKYGVNNLRVLVNFNAFGAYDQVDISVIARLQHIIKNLGVLDTRRHWFMKLYGAEAHYKVLNQDEYEEICLTM